MHTYTLKDLNYPKEYDCTCKICGTVFKVSRKYLVGRRKLCDSRKCLTEDRKLAMRRYRQTEKGKEKVKRDNLRYKRPDLDKVCEVCGETFKTARLSRYICDKPECKKKAGYYRMKKYINSNREKSRARDIISKSINRESSLKRGVCVVCSEPDAQAHHHNYSKPKDIIFLCREHHKSIHSWDSV